MKRSDILLCLVVLVALFSLPAAAQEEEHQLDPPYDGPCIGPNDPYCGGGGGGGGVNLGCSECQYVPDGPDGEPGGWQCWESNDPAAFRYTDCVELPNGCDVGGYCYLV